MVVFRMENQSSVQSETVMLDESVPDHPLILAPFETDSQEDPLPLSPSPLPSPVVVYISGAVRHPDVYQLPPDARVNDVVQAAGGFTEDADRIRINLAAHIQDAQHIHVLRVGEDPLLSDTQMGEPAPSGSVVPNVVNINTATVAELDQLEGIGPVLAQRIVDYRTENGSFTSVDDLQNVRGISAALVDRLRAYVTVGQ